MKKMKVSILIPFKNTENYLNECLDSIVKQTYVNWEVICVNDHSIDSSLEIANKFALSNPKIKVVNNKGNGLIDALKTAYNLSTGNLITRMDSDDIMLSNKISSMAEDLLNFGAGHIALGMVKYFSEKELGNGYKNYETWLNSLTSKGLNFNEIYEECVIPSPCWMVHREDLEKVNNFESEIYPEDYDLAFRFYQIGLKCIKSNKVLHMWRDYPNRTSRTNSNYADNSFLKLKINYFLKLSYNENKKLVVWGAGKKGKKVASILNELKVSFLWVCDNPKKIGKKIYDNYLEDWQIISNLTNYQSIITIASPDAQNYIKSFFKKKNKVELADYFFFC